VTENHPLGEDIIARLPTQPGFLLR